VLIREAFGPDFPSISELTKNISLYFLNNDPFLEFARPISSKVISIGGLVETKAGKLDQVIGMGQRICKLGNQKQFIPLNIINLNKLVLPNLIQIFNLENEVPFGWCQGRCRPRLFWQRGGQSENEPANGVWNVDRILPLPKNRIHHEIGRGMAAKSDGIVFRGTECPCL
jgi:hypothetical protein